MFGKRYDVRQPQPRPAPPRPAPPRPAGITEEMLAGVTTTLADVQARLRALVPAETLLVMHSGENDLQALKVGARRVRLCSRSASSLPEVLSWASRLSSLTTPLPSTPACFSVPLIPPPPPPCFATLGGPL